MNLVFNLQERVCHANRVTYAFIHVVAVCCVWLFCNPMNCSLPCSSVHGISQSSILEWVVISLARELSQDRTQVSRLAGDFFTTEPPGKPTFIQPADIYWELVRQCCRFWGCHSHQETKCLSFWSLSSPEEVEKQANAYVTKSQCWYMQSRKVKQNLRRG